MDTPVRHDRPGHSADDADSTLPLLSNYAEVLITDETKYEDEPWYSEVPRSVQSQLTCGAHVSHAARLSLGLLFSSTTWQLFAKSLQLF